jgi:hypothetical protein
VADQPGIDLMRRRIERASRQAPPSRRPAEPTDETPLLASAPVPGQAPAVVPPTPAVAEPSVAPRRAAATRRSRGAAPMRLGADLPPVNLAIRVRKPLDDRLAEVIHQLRGDGVRTSKVELIEMLLWEMPDDDPSAIRERLRRFRDWAPRGTGAPLGPEGAGD